MMDPNKKFDSLGREFHETWVKRHPLMACSLGFYSDWCDDVPDGTLAHELESQKFLHRLLDDVKALDPKKLDDARRLERDYAIYLLELWLFEREEVRLWEMTPEAPQVIGHAIFQLLSRSTPALNLRMRSIMRRLEKMPKYIDESRQKLRNPVKLFVENELETLSRLPAFFNHIKSIGMDHLPPTPQRQLHRLLEGVQNALQKYEDWLIIDILPDCKAEWPVGEAKLRKLFEKRGIDESPTTLLKWGESEVERLRERLKEIGRGIKRKVMIEDVRDIVKQQHPDNFDGVLRFMRDAVNKLRQFVSRSKFATMPDQEALFVVETPTYLRHNLPHTTYQAPGKFEPKESKHEGYFFVSPGDCDSDKLKEHNYASLVSRAVHGTYPGHHLMAAWQREHPSPWRTFAAAPETVEGWAHYCEERVKEMGYDDSPPSRFMATVEQVFRAGQMVMDIRLAQGKMSPVQAVEYLIDWVGMDRIAAEAEVRRYVVTPGYQVSYLLGKERMKELKKHIRERMRGRFTEQFFHTAVLQSGGLPTRLLKQELEMRADEELRRPVPKTEEEAAKEHKKGAKKQDAPAPKKAEALKEPAKKAKPATAAKKAAPKKKPAKKSRPKPRRKPKAKSKLRPKPRKKPARKPKSKARKPKKRR